MTTKADLLKQIDDAASQYGGAAPSQKSRREGTSNMAKRTGQMVIGGGGGLSVLLGHAERYDRCASPAAQRRHEQALRHREQGEQRGEGRRPRPHEKISENARGSDNQSISLLEKA